MTINALLKVNQPRFVAIILAYLVSSLTLVLNSYVLMYVVNYLKNRDLAKWTQFMLLELLISVGSYLFPRLATYLVQQQTQDYNHSVRQGIVRSYYTHNKHVKVPEAQNHLINDLSLVNDNYLSNFFFVISDVFTIALAAITLLMIHWVLLLVTLIIVAVSIYLPKFLNKRLINATNRVSTSNQKYLETLHNWLGGIDELRHYLAGSKLFKVTRYEQNKLSDAYVNYAKKQQLINLLNEFSSNLFSLILFVVAGILIKNNLIIFGTIVAIGNYHYYISGAIEDINFSLQGMKSVEELNLKLKEETSYIPIKDEKKKSGAIGIELNGLSYNYPDNHIDFPNLEIKPGEKVLLTGSNGRGKSTLLDIISGEKSDYDGKLSFKNQTRAIEDFDKLQINYMKQESTIFPGNAVDNITMFDTAYQKDAVKVISELNLNLNKSGEKFSGGQKQIISILRNVVNPSNILLIDEGLSGVDDANKERILKYLSNLPQTVVLVEHNLNKDLKRYFTREITV